MARIRGQSAWVFWVRLVAWSALVVGVGIALWQRDTGIIILLISLGILILTPQRKK